MNYIIELMDGAEIEITEEEFSKLGGKSGVIYIPSANQIINTSYIKRVASKSVIEIDRYLDRKKETQGILHDGTMVVRYFGAWYLAGVIDEKGKPSKVIDQNYYPEIARDCVPTPAEYQLKYAHLPQEERKQLMISSLPRQKSDLTVIGETVEKFLD